VTLRRLRVGDTVTETVLESDGEGEFDRDIDIVVVNVPV